MKVLVNIARLLVGGLFIFSGLVKAIDPLGLTYKMQEFFEVWAREGYVPSLMNMFYDFSFPLSIVMIVLEVALGVALLLGWRIKLTNILLFLLIVFFTFLTSYVLFSGKIAACGCFGDCIPLTPVQTFSKDIALLVLVLLLMWKQEHILPVLPSKVSFVIVLLSVIGVSWLQFHVVSHLPLVDCLPYKKGNNILKLREMPANAIPDKYDYRFAYEKGGTIQEFDMNHLPDSTWKFVERKQVLIQKGSNNVPVIKDFILTDSSGADATETVLSTAGPYYLFFIRDFTDGADHWAASFALLHRKATQQNRPVYIITGDADNAQLFFNSTNHYDVHIYSCDVTAIKTAARTNPALYEMNGPVVQQKFGCADLDHAVGK